MRSFLGLAANVAFFLAGLAPVHAQTDGGPSIGEKIESLNWIETPGIHRIDEAKASYELSENEVMVVGDDARALSELTRGEGSSEGIVMTSLYLAGPLKDSAVLLTYAEIGFVDDSDWSSVDPDEIWNLLTQQQETDNENRRKSGVVELYFKEWAAPPRYDAQTNTAYWAFNLTTSENEDVVNASAIKLGRYGISTVVWAGSPSQFANGTPLESALANFSFDSGSQYADYVEGDALAGLGLGALAVSLMKGKGAVTAAAAVGVLAKVLLYAKKFWYLIFVPVIVAWRYFRRKPEGDAQA